MKPISALLYECTAEEVRTLPVGFQFLEYDSLYGGIRLMQAGVTNVRSDKRYVYLCYKEPPMEWKGRAEKKSKRKPYVTDNVMRRAVDNV